MCHITFSIKNKSYNNLSILSLYIIAEVKKEKNVLLTFTPFLCELG